MQKNHFEKKSKPVALTRHLPANCINFQWINNGEVVEGILADVVVVVVTDPSSA